MDDWLDIRLLGGFAVTVAGVTAADEAWRLSRARTLVKLLAVQPDQRLHREQAMALLWPERDVVSAANNLRQVAHCARRALALEHLSSTGQMLRSAVMCELMSSCSSGRWLQLARRVTRAPCIERPECLHR